MLKYAIIFAIISLIAGALGFTGVAAGSAGIAKILFIVFLVLAVLFVVMAVLGIGAAKKSLKLSFELTCICRDPALGQGVAMPAYTGLCKVKGGLDGKHGFPHSTAGH